MEIVKIKAQLSTADKAEAKARRFRNILANSGDVMESGEVRDLGELYVMKHDGNLIKISELDTDPDAQKETYSVKAQADHGEVIDGELIPSIMKVFGDCKVWLEKDGLHARMYFANDDQLADHAWAISDNASYSIGIDWYPEGYYGAGLEIEEAIGVLREISMVVTGNDPRAKTIDHLEHGSEAHGSEPVDDGVNNNKENDDMTEIKSIDELSREEAEEIKAEVADVVEQFTAPEPAEAGAEAKDEEPAQEETKTADTLRSPIVVIKDRMIKQEEAVKMTDTKAGKIALTDALKASNGKFDQKFYDAYEANLAKHSIDAVSGLKDPLGIGVLFTNALEKSDGIINYFNRIGGKGLRNNVLNGTGETARAKGHKKGEAKQDQELTNNVRDIFCKMVYKKLTLDAMEVYENPELVNFRAQELVDSIITEIERAAIIGDGRSESTPDYRMFDGTSRGFFSIAGDADDQSGYGSLVASTYTAGTGANLYDGVVGAKGQLFAEGEQILIVKPTVLTAAYQAKVNDRYLIEPGATAEDIFRVAKVFAPQWMSSATHDAYLLARNAYAMVGEENIRVQPHFDVSTNSDILLDETPRGGSLVKYKGAVAIKLGE